MSTMNLSTLSPEQDPMGAAILDYLRTGRAQDISVLSSMFDDDVIPVAHLFRKPEQMPPIEQKALELAKGRILDAGAGAGCHALALQEQGKNVTAIDISPLSVEAMKLRGIQNAQCINLFDPRLGGGYDTILLLMNGSGLIGNLKNMPEFFANIRTILAPNGQILLDSSDLKYLYENPDGSYDIDPTGPYYGQVDYQMRYKNIKGKRFDWLYIDFDTLNLLAETNGFKCQLVLQGKHYDYLARLTHK